MDKTIYGPRGEILLRPYDESPTPTKLPRGMRIEDLPAVEGEAAARSYLAGALTALNSTETDEKAIGDIKLPAGSQLIESFWVYANAGAGVTTLENRSGIFKITSDDLRSLNITVPLEIITVLTEGTVVYQVRLWPLGQPAPGLNTLTGKVTLDLAQTINPSARWGLVVQGAQT